MDSIIASRQLRWVGKIACMSESRLPRKFINAWHQNPRPIGRPLTTIRHTYLFALKLIGAIREDDDDGRLSDWMPPIQQNPAEWEACRLALTPHNIGYVPAPTIG